MIIHKVFLTWLLYLVIIILIGVGLCYLNIAQIAIDNDRSYLTLVLLAMYGLSEILSARQAWIISKEHVIASNVSKWVRQNNLTSSRVLDDDSIILSSGLVNYVVPCSETSKHFIALGDMAADGNQVNQNILLTVLSNRLNSQISIISFVAGRVVWIGILATILGVILAFWPLLSTGMTIEAIRPKLGGFFSGIAVAFIPTAASFVFKIALDFSTKILSNGSLEIVNMVARASETKILPMFERNVTRHGGVQ